MGSPKHSQIKMNLSGSLWGRLRGKPCVPYDSDLRIRCRTGLYTYPDASVICGDLEFDDEKKDTVLNPTLIVEVVSKTTEAYDRGKKFAHYSTIPALREYVLVSQDEPMMQCFLRNDDGTWTLTSVSGMDQTLKLSSIDVELPLAEVFDRVDFTSDDPESIS
jgi:Uma2 family endonuclease